MLVIRQRRDRNSHGKKAKDVENANFMTLNEKREAFGLPPLQDGDKLS
ncbi:phage portal protein, HK97 family [Wolbachia endosymbiont of Armadillidium vulgare str. wVulC]|nr:phage portal protein, HK97 family [Wolbachia endosymbiont of Armadillidium vulgare str. wVulC]